MTSRSLFILFPILTALATLHSAEPAHPYFAITVIDEQTGRGVPLVELRTVSEIRYVTDSNGVIAFLEPGLMGRDVYFAISSHGYTFPKDGFGFAGKILRVKAGGAVTLKIQRNNIAERLYRITGEGIYRDSILIGKLVPVREPLLNAQVSGQDSTLMVEYKGKYHWFFGDTNKPGYPLGHYGMSGATSQKIENGGLNPDKGVDLTYFVDAAGFSRPMCPWGEPNMKWIDRVTVLRDKSGAERMVARCARMKSLDEVRERTFVVYDDASNTFKSVTPLEGDDEPATGQSFPAKSDGVDYIYFAMPYPTVRVKADYESYINPAEYEFFSCLKDGGAYSKNDPALDRDGGKLIWKWRKNTAPITLARQKELLDAGGIKASEAWFKLSDAGSGKSIYGSSGTIQFNAYRKRWIMLLNERLGTSMLGEVWYSESDSPEGPWEKARKIVTHDKYSFYNVIHHPQFDQDGGKIIYFEGTYTVTFSGNTTPTPRYEYNQMMYRLDLSDPRLKF